MAEWPSGLIVVLLGHELGMIAEDNILNMHACTPISIFMNLGQEVYAQHAS